ncbi:SprT-like domain-containing protein [Poriferisphaera sp. WC338]|uniref:SprT family zinc-dependent metalloprotease n=1 Tax=Poriferisphaera sp. WC338 TaxID=3425129 RepID=UPI003D8162E7
MNPWDARQLALELLKAHDLSDWSFTFNHRKRSLGLCRYREKQIELSLHYIKRNEHDAIKDTILHEIAHALAGHEAGHGPKWIKKCQEIGANPQRLDTTATMPKGNYSATCPGCQKIHHRYRRPLKGRKYFCKPCGPSVGQLVFGRPSSAT